MGNKDWSHLRSEHQNRFSKGQPKEAPLEKGSPEKLEDTLAKEPEVVEVPAFQEEVKQEDEPAIGVKEDSYDPKEASLATPEDESAQIVLATPLTKEARSETPAQDTIGQSPSAEKKVEHQGGSRLISEADLASIGGGGHSEPRQPVLDSQSDRTKTYSPSSKSEGSSLAAFFGLLAMLGLFAYLASGGIHSEEHPSSTTSEYGSTGLSYGTRKETLKSGTSTLIAPEGEFQFQVTYEKAISLIPGLSEGDQGRTSSTSLSPQDVVAVLGKASSGEETYQEGGVSPFMTQLDYGSEGSPSSVTVLLSKIGVDRLSSLDFENLNSERLANKNGSLNREDFANMKIGTSYSDLVNTVGIPSSVSWSSMLGSESFLTFYYKLSDSRSVIIHFGSNRTISEIKGLEDPAISTSTSP
ncbi:hypothetical protein GMC95_09925 [Streptococcus parasanguinis]|jgi:hypothetical protein|uniref:hypothetical protein n=1 Tax=Streptococcus parasanguinis TaxID=1318 RepID=UPI0012BCACF2|nr:hypothetical protein [Streptococcus parasanguinis]MTS09829.1 hypothetical protein [Streptococcus parasanguinis]